MSKGRFIGNRRVRLESRQVGVWGEYIAATARFVDRVHQRVAKTYGVGRGFIAGDAAHINNPLGGMGMNGGVHDAWNLAHKLVAVMRGYAGPTVLERYEAERRPIALEYINEITIGNKRNLETDVPSERVAFLSMLRAVRNSEERTRDLLCRVSMISSLGDTYRTHWPPRPTGDTP